MLGTHRSFVRISAAKDLFVTQIEILNRCKISLNYFLLQNEEACLVVN